MQIATAFEIGQEVWLMSDNKVVKANVWSIRVQVSNTKGVAPGIQYSLNGKEVPGGWAGNEFFAEELLFQSKSQLLATL